MRAVLKQEVVPKKVTRKTVSRVVKAVSEKTPKKKVVAKKSVPTVRKKRVAKAVLEEPEIKPKDEIETVFVPGAASLRLLEKAELYRVWYKNNFPLQVAKVARVGGYAFILLGTILATAAYLTNKDAAEYRAALVCSNSVCSEIADNDLPPTAPLVTFKNSLPENLKSDTDIIIDVDNATDFKVYIKNLATGERTEITYLEALPEYQYRYLVSPQAFNPGAHQLVAEVEVDAALYKFLGPQFTVERKEVLPEVEEIKPVEETETLSTSVVENVDEVESTDETELTSDSATSTAEGEEVVTEEEPVLESDEEEEEETEIEEVTSLEEVTEEIVSETAPIAAFIQGSKDAEYLKIQTGTLLPEIVYVYSEVASSGQPLFLGQATRVQGDWIFSLSALQLPTLSHFLYASFEVDGVTYRSTGTSFSPSYALEELIDGDISLLVQKVELALFEKDTYNRAQYFSELNSTSSTIFERANELQLADGALLDTLDEYLVTDTDTLNQLLAKYAQVAQVGQDYLITLASSNLNRHVGLLSRQIADESGDRSVVPPLQTVLSQRYQKLKELVAEAESKLNLETSSLTSRDTDSDGISDYDEITVYLTSPVSADSDKDGVIDAIEVLTDSDPLASDLLAVVSPNHSPEDISYNEAVTITQVEPLVVRSLEYASDAVQAIVHGKSVPNSYVHILSPSMGTVGVIKTNSNGDFSYTLEMPLPDRRHEVVAVMTDTVGNIIASSKPHIFTKTESVFVAAAAGSQNVFFGSDEARVALQFSTITTAIGVVALGLVLLLFYHTLRSRKLPSVKEKLAK